MSATPVIIYSFVARGTTVFCEHSGNFTGNFSQVRVRERERWKEEGAMVKRRAMRWVFFFFDLLLR